MNDKKECNIYKQAATAPFANFTGEALLKEYNDLQQRKANIEWELYYACLEINNRLTYIQMNGKESLPIEMIPLVNQPNKPTEQPTSSASKQEKIIISENYSPINLNAKSIFQGNVDKIVEKELEKKRGV